MLLSCYLSQVKNESIKVYMERLYALVNDAFATVDIAVVESQLVGISFMGCTLTSCT